ncbi:MAG: histidine phosphatase family protein [Campylobacterota bacterium]
MKTLYLIKHAKSDWSVPGESDMERDITKKGLKHINTIGSYLALQGINPDVILSSCALRAQETSNVLAQKIDFSGPQYYLQELYQSSPELIKEIIMAQDDELSSMFIVGHNPQLSELVFMLSGEHIAKMPSLAIVAIKFDIQEWSELQEKQGTIEFFISPKQFKYYMPKHIRTTLEMI